MLIGGAVLFYAIVVVCYVQFIPDLGIKSAFNTEIKGLPRVLVKPGIPKPKEGDQIIQLGDLKIDSWPRLLRAPFELRDKLAKAESLPKIDAKDIPQMLAKGTQSDGKTKWAYRVNDNGRVYYLIRGVFQRTPETGEPFKLYGWCILDRLPASELIPSISWFMLKLLLFVVGVLVLWKRPDDPAAVQFFVLCVVTLGAFMGGYHWSHISTEPRLIVGFIFCSILLPAVTLHFYLVFPRIKPILAKKPNWTLAAVYSVPLLFLAIILFEYALFRFLFHGNAPAVAVENAGRQLVYTVYVYVVFAAILYILSVAALIHSHLTAKDVTERNQVKCILFGAVLATFPLSYSLYLVILDPDSFAAGWATWPMFTASIFITAAFIISITRYRLMELDQLISSGAVYFLISFIVGLGYYGVVFLGTLIFTQGVASPPFSEALRVSSIALILLLVLDIARTRFKKALDRRFNREKYHLDRTLQRMSDAVQQLVDPPTLVQRLLYASSDLLGVSRGGVYLWQADQKNYRLAGWVGPAPSQVEVSCGPLTEELRQKGAVTSIPRQEPSKLEALAQLKQLGGEVAHGLGQDGRLLAFVVFGPKSNGAFRQEDLNLLAAFAQITTLALGSAEGHDTIEALNGELQEKIEKIAEQQRRIFALQTQLRRQGAHRPLSAGNTEDGKPEHAADAAGRLSQEESGASHYSNAAGTRNTIVGTGPEMQELLHMIEKVAKTDSVVLIRGESGTGKELLAEAVHQISPRRDKAFVKVHCAALSPTLLESELFGHVKGAFTGAHRNKVGRFEMANGGTLFLDELGDISLEVQTKLLRVLQEQTFERVGSSEPVKVDVRIITATHQNLEDLIRRGEFREDLYYRLNVFPVSVPPLRERTEDIPELVMHFLGPAAERCGKGELLLDDDAMAVLKSYDWPGNIRQLENVIERVVVLVEGPVITAEDLPDEIHRHPVSYAPTTHPPARANPHRPRLPDDASLPNRIPISRSEREEFERRQLLHAIKEAQGNKAQAARKLGMARSTLISRLKKLGIG